MGETRHSADAPKKSCGTYKQPKTNFAYTPSSGSLALTAVVSCETHRSENRNFYTSIRNMCNKCSAHPL